MFSSMENHIKHKITRIFRSSFASCKTKNITDVTAAVIDEKPVFHPQQNPHHLFPPKSPPFLSFDHHILFPTTTNSPPFPPKNPDKHKTTAPQKKSKTTRARASIRQRDFPDFSAFSYNGLFSSDDEETDDDDRATLFSSVSFSFSSDSSESFRRRRAERIRRRRRRAARKKRTAAEAAAEKDTCAVVKKSRDPYGDFRASMLEMIMEKQIFGAKDLEKLLDCFLSLNSHRHHKVIIHVFTEICEALFSNFCP